MTFDEFQLCRTIDDKGMEVDRIGLRPLWELIDSGVFFAYRDYNFDIIRLYRTLLSLKDANVIVENGIVVEEVESYNMIASKSYDSQIYDFAGAISQNNTKVVDTKKPQPIDSSVGSKVNKVIGEKPHFIKLAWLKILVDQNHEFFNNVEACDLERFLVCDEKDMQTKEKETLIKLRSCFNEYSIVEILGVIKNKFVKKVESPKRIDLSQSLIFCIGNLDEAYKMTHTVNPDADADLFHQHSLKITIPKIKKALSARFRMEQIGRLGNNHIIYPSFSKDNYVNIIKYYLNQRVTLFKSEYSINLKFTSAIEDIIYKEAVYPTQGIRPVLSTLSNLIDSFVSIIISDILMEASNVESVDSIVWDYDGKKSNFIVNVFSKNKTVLEKNYSIVLTIEKLRKTDRSEKQAYTAIHEAGHAIMGIFDYGLLPKEVVSKTASDDALGFCTFDFPDIVTKDSIIKEIRLLYGGIEAERLIFGDSMISTGASSDLTRASNHIVNYFKTYGMSDILIKTLSMEDRDAVGNRYMKTEAFEKDIQDMADKLRNETSEILIKYKPQLLKLGNVLTKRSKVTTSDIIKMFKLGDVKFKNSTNYYGFKKKIKEEMEKENIPVKHLNNHEPILS